jgi:hypothetical protein
MKLAKDSGVPLGGIERVKRKLQRHDVCMGCMGHLRSVNHYTTSGAAACAQSVGLAMRTSRIATGGYQRMMGGMTR